MELKDNCFVRVDNNGQKWAMTNNGNKRITHEFEKKWIVLRQVQQDRLKVAFPDKFGIIFVYDAIDHRINGKFDVSNRSCYHTTKSGVEAFEDFIEHIEKTYDDYSLAICSFQKEVVESKLENINKYRYYAGCGVCGYQSKRYDSFDEICSDYPDDLCDCGDHSLDIVKERV